MKKFLSSFWYIFRIVLVIAIIVAAIWLIVQALSGPSPRASMRRWYSLILLIYFIINMGIIFWLNTFSRLKFLVFFNLAVIITLTVGQFLRLFDFFQAWPESMRFVWGLPAVSSIAVILVIVFIACLPSD